jgi:CRP-like cAMP-binding protein
VLENLRKYGAIDDLWSTTVGANGAVASAADSDRHVVRSCWRLGDQIDGAAEAAGDMAMNILASLPTIRALTISGLVPKAPPLTDRQRQKLAAVSTLLRFQSGAIVYREGDPADAVFINGDGVVVSFRDMPSGKRRVAGFRFAADVFGLAEGGVYVNTARAITPSSVYRLPLDALTALLRQDADIQFQLLCKVVHEVRQQQRKAIIVARRDAPGRIAMFIDMLRQRRASGPPVDDIVTLPMTRSDIGDYLNLTLETISRACRRLSDAGLVRFSTGSVQILDRARFDKLIGKT